MDNKLWVARRDFYKGLFLCKGERTTFFVASDFDRNTSYLVTRDAHRHYHLTKKYKGKNLGTVRMYKHDIEFITNIRIMVGKEPTKAFLEDARNNTTID